MALNFRDYENALKYGAKIIEGDMGTGSVGSAALLANSVIAAKVLNGTLTGAKSSLNYAYATIAFPIDQGITTRPVFYGSTTAPVAGTVTGFWVVSDSGTATATWTLYASTTGTIAVIANGTTAYFAKGTSILSAAIVAGDTVQAQGPNVGSATGYITFVTAN